MNINYLSTYGDRGRRERRAGTEKGIVPGDEVLSPSRGRRWEAARQRWGHSTRQGRGQLRRLYIISQGQALQMEDIHHLSGGQWRRTEHSQLGTAWRGTRPFRGEAHRPRPLPAGRRQPLGTMQMQALASLADATKHNLVLTTRSICSLTQCNVADTWRKKRENKRVFVFVFLHDLSSSCFLPRAMA